MFWTKVIYDLASSEPYSLRSLNGGQIIDNQQIDNLQIDNRQIDNRQIDNLTNFWQIDNGQIANLSFSKIDSAIPLPWPHGLGKSTSWCCYLYHGWGGAKPFDSEAMGGLFTV